MNKHSKKKPKLRPITAKAKAPTQPDLLDAKSVKPLPAAKVFATAAQLFTLTGLDDAALRRLCNPSLDSAINPATHATWIPKPIGGRYDMQATLLGVIAWQRARLDDTSTRGLPAMFPSQKDFSAQTGLSGELLDHLRKRGIPVIVGSRVDFRAVLRGIAELGVQNLDVIDGAYEDKRLTRERADEQAMLNAEKRGEILFNRDQTVAIQELPVTELIFDQGLSPIKKDLLELTKRHGCYEEMKQIFRKHLGQLWPEQNETIDEKRDSTEPN